MQTSYTVNRDPAIEGLTVGPRESVPRTLPYLAQIEDVVIADGTPAAGETWTVVVTDDETEQVFSMSFLSGATLPDTLDNWVAAWLVSGKLNDLFTVSEDGVDTATFTARNSNRTYTFAVAAGGSATAAPSTTQAAGGAGLEFGLMVASNGVPGEVRALASGDTVADIEGFLFRTDVNHFHVLDESFSDVDTLDRGKTLSVLEEGRAWVLVPTGVAALSDPVHIRINNGRVGEFRNAADGGDTVDASAFCKWETLASAGELAQVRIRKQG